MGTENFGQKTLENWPQVEQNYHVIGGYVWTLMACMGRAVSGHALIPPATEKGSKTVVLRGPGSMPYVVILIESALRKRELIVTTLSGETRSELSRELVLNFTLVRRKMGMCQKFLTHAHFALQKK